MNIAHGHAKTEDSFSAGKQAAEQASETVNAPDLVFVFSGVDHASEELLDGVGEVFGDADIIGCSTGGELWNEGLTTGSVVLMALEDETLSTGIGVGRPISEDNREAGRTAAKEAVDALGEEEVAARTVVKEEEEWHEQWPVNFTVFMTTLTGNGSEVMRGVKDVLGEGAHVSGGLAGDDWQLEETYVYHNGEVLTDAIIVAAMETENIISHGIRHGLQKTENRYEVTASEDNVVQELDGTPVAEIYRDIFGKRGESAQFLMTKPLGIEVGEEESRLRDPLIIQDEDDSIVYAAEVQEGSMVHIMESPRDSVVDAARTAAEQAMEEAGNPDPENVNGIIMHDCVCRWYCLDDDETRKKEIDAVKSVVGEDTPVVGWYTYGEIALPRALAGVHNQTLVAQLFVEQED